MNYSTWKYLIDNGYQPVEYIYKPDNFSNPDFGLGIIAYGNKYGLEVKMQALQEDMDYAMAGHQLQVCGYFGKTRIDNLPYQNFCTVYIRQNDGYYLGRQENAGWYTKSDGTIIDNSSAVSLIKPCDTDIHIVSTYYDSESDLVKTFLDGVLKHNLGSRGWENDLTAGTEYFVYGNSSSGQYAFKGRIYYIKTFDDERNVTGHFIPCVRKSDGRAGLYDIVNNVFKVPTYDYIKAGPDIIAKQIPWAVGTGNIRLTYTGVGDGTIIVESDENNLDVSRSKQVTVETTRGEVIERTVTIVQEAKVRTDISTAVVTAPTQTYSGSALTPTPTVTLNGNVVASSNYDVAYSNNINAGNGTITITGKGDYTGTATGTFTINKASGSVTSAPIAISNTYSGGSKYLVTTGSGTGTIYYRYKLSTSSSWSSWSTTRPSVINAGTYNIEYYAAESTNYNQSSTGSINATMAKANRTLSFSSPTTVVTKNSTVTNIATPSAGSGDGTITYSSSSTSLATVNSNGVVTGKSDGNVTITATISAGTNYNSASASYTIAVIQYNSNGLVFYLDGINKGTDSNHWTDLIGGLQFAYNNCTKGTNCVTFNGTGVTKTLCSKTFPQTSCTIEIVCDYCAQPSFVMFAPHKGDVLAGFSSNANGIAAFSWASNSAHLNYCCDTDKFYAGNNDMTVCNGKTIRQQVTDSWGAQIDGYMKLGGRGTDRFYTGNIYAIRIYNRKLTKNEIVANQTIDNQRFGFNIPLDQDYISSGLVFKLDGINKGNTSGSWTDLVGNIKFPLTNATAGSNYVEFNGTGSIQAASSTTFSQDSCTIETNCDYASGVILYPSKVGNIAAIRNPTNTFNYGTSSAPRYVTDTNKYTSINADNCVDKLYVRSKTSNDNWGAQIDGKIKIGGRNTDYFYTGKIYAIRIYNRKLSIIEMRHNQRRDIERFELGLT